MKILITGTAGFIGSTLVDRLITDGYDVIIIDDLSTGQNKIFETFSNINDKTLALDEAFRFIQICDPKL